MCACAPSRRSADCGPCAFLIVVPWLRRGSCLCLCVRPRVQVDPSGAYFGWRASALGVNHVNAVTFLERRYSEEMELEDAIHTALLTLREGFEVGAVTVCRSWALVVPRGTCRCPAHGALPAGPTACSARVRACPGRDDRHQH